MTKSLKIIIKGVFIVLMTLTAVNGLQAFATDIYPDYERGGAGTSYNLEQAVITKHLDTTCTFDLKFLGGADLQINDPYDAILTGYLSTGSSPSTGATQKRWYKRDTSYSIYAS